MASWASSAYETGGVGLRSLKSESDIPTTGENQEEGDGRGSVLRDRRGSIGRSEMVLVDSGA